VETAAAVEIDKVAYGNFFYMISTAAWKSRKRTSGFSTVTTGSAAINSVNFISGLTCHLIVSH